MSRASGTHVSAPTHPWAKVQTSPAETPCQKWEGEEANRQPAAAPARKRGSLPELGCSSLALQRQQLLLLQLLPFSFDVALPGQFQLCSQVCGRLETKCPLIPRHPLCPSSCSVKEMINSHHSA